MGGPEKSDKKDTESEQVVEGTAVKTSEQQDTAESGQADTSQDSSVQTEPKSTD
jgi:hypothetical protein